MIQELGMVEISEKLWRKAHQIGDLRQKTNKNRSGHHDRGDNARFDTMGIVGEILLLRWLKKTGVPLPSREEINRHLLDPRGGVYLKGPDGGQYDAKFFNLGQPEPVYCKINDRKHNQLEGDCEAYFGVISDLHSKQAFLVLVPYEDVDKFRGWAMASFGYCDPCLVKPVTDILTEDVINSIRNDKHDIKL